MRNGSIRGTLSAVLVAVLLCSGCGESLPVAPVSGTITYEGKPLVGATITTQPIAGEGDANPGSGSFGKTDAEGRYELEVVEPAMKGAIIGSHRVTIVPGTGTEDPWADDAYVERDSTWPGRFKDGSLTLEVPEGGRQDADFQLTAD